MNDPRAGFDQAPGGAAAQAAPLLLAHDRLGHRWRGCAAGGADEGDRGFPPGRPIISPKAGFSASRITRRSICCAAARARRMPVPTRTGHDRRSRRRGPPPCRRRQPQHPDAPAGGATQQCHHDGRARPFTRRDRRCPRHDPAGGQGGAASWPHPARELAEEPEDRPMPAFAEASGRGSPAISSISTRATSTRCAIFSPRR